MRVLTASCLVVAACGYPSLPKLGEAPSGEDAGGSDKPPPDANLCFGSYVKVCFSSIGDVPTTPAPLPADASIEIDTGASSLCNQANNRKNEYCVIVGTDIRVSVFQSLRAFGPKPLVLLSTATIELSGNIDVSSNRSPGPVNTGAGANAAGMCAGLSEPVADAGGYGGSFQGPG
ncbi:MAG TPA: hypothetical protein VFK02_15775, partial [Kofleriaceae bacterium]|nr:hypothetical protein [Kofleriaceae bacterium]